MAILMCMACAWHVYTQVLRGVAELCGHEPQTAVGPRGAAKELRFPREHDDGREGASPTASPSRPAAPPHFMRATSSSAAHERGRGAASPAAAAEPPPAAAAQADTNGAKRSPAQRRSA